MAVAQVCLPVKWLDLAYNLVKNHDGSTAFLVVDHDEEDMIAAKAPIGNIYAPGLLLLCGFFVVLYIHLAKKERFRFGQPTTLKNGDLILSEHEGTWPDCSYV